MDEDPKSLARSNASSKVQGMAHIVEKSQTEAIGLSNQKMPGFVHLIT